jgi:hypothetical protein
LKKKDNQDQVIATQTHAKAPRIAIQSGKTIKDAITINIVLDRSLNEDS